VRSRSRKARGRRRPTFTSGKPARAANEWDILLTREEEIGTRARLWAHARLVAAGATPSAGPADAIQAGFGVAWTDPTFPVFYDLLVNGIDAGPPYEASGGRILRDIILHPGQNRLDWGIHHTGQGWKNAVFLKVADQAFKLSEDSDPSTGDDDDLSSGTAVFSI
jgi:hypothetical protein